MSPSSDLKLDLEGDGIPVTPCEKHEILQTRLDVLWQILDRLSIPYHRFAV